MNTDQLRYQVKSLQHEYRQRTSYDSIGRDVLGYDARRKCHIDKQLIDSYQNVFKQQSIFLHEIHKG